MKNGDFVSISYTGKVKGGKVFDTTDETAAKKAEIFNEKAIYGPVTVVVGAGHVFKGLDKVLESMKVGETKTVELTPEDAFGSRDSKKVQLLPLKYFKNQKVKPAAGMKVQIGGAFGTVQSVTGGRVSVDFNHPLAGKALEYEIELKKEIKKIDAKVKGLLSLHLRQVEAFSIAATESTVTVTIPETHDIPKAVMAAVAGDLKKWTSIKSVKFVHNFA